MASKHSIDLNSLPTTCGHSVSWMSIMKIGAGTPKYTMRLHEIPDASAAQARKDFKQFADAAFEDVRSCLRQALTPLGSSRGLPIQAPTIGVDPAAGFPSRLHDSVKKGILGELWAGFLAEEVVHDGLSGWHVPKFLFRFHKAALDQLQRTYADDVPLPPVPGRLGDDCIAVRINDDDTVYLLIAEAKCTEMHSSSLVKAAHKSFKPKEVIPADLINLISILGDYDDEESSIYLSKLQHCYVLATQNPSTPPERMDYLVYVYGQKPVRNQTWISGDTPRREYEGGRVFEASEVYLKDIDKWLDEVLGA